MLKSPTPSSKEYNPLFTTPPLVPSCILLGSQTLPFTYLFPPLAVSWNERQNSEEVPLIFGNNLRERFRIWRTPIPRHSKSLIRMRNGWQFIKLGLKNDNNRKVILHDINVKYSI